LLLTYHKRKTQSNQTLPKPTFDAAAGIYSSVNDLSKWAIMQMNNGNTVLKQAAVLPKEHDEMWHCKLLFQLKRQLRIIPFQWIWARLVLSDVKGYKQVTHTGGLEGIVTQTIYELQLGIIVLTNQQSGAAFNAITNTIKTAI
jgi:CubicO group peptidase (beta-lactamase class C family)